MVTTDEVLHGGIGGAGDDRVLRLDPTFAGLPETAHGGSVLAAFEALAGLDGPREVRGLYQKRVPLGVPLRLTVRRLGETFACHLLDASDVVLVEGRVGPAPSSGEVGHGAVAVLAASSLAPEVSLAPDTSQPLPISSSCFACGTDNPIGLRLRLGSNDAAVFGTWQPRAAFAKNGHLAPIALTTLLDEAAFWLGVLATGESGMTTDLCVTLQAPVPFGVPITVSGARAGVQPRPDDARYWSTAVVARDDAGRILATAAITFVAIRGAARRLAKWLSTKNPPDVVRRAFPAYGGP